MLGFGSDHKARHVLYEEQRRLVAVAGLYEEGCLLRAFGVDDTAEARGLTLLSNHAARVGYDAYLYTAQASVARYHLARVVRLKLVQVPFVQNALKDFAHVVGLSMV